MLGASLFGQQLAAPLTPMPIPEHISSHPRLQDGRGGPAEPHSAWTAALAPHRPVRLSRLLGAHWASERPQVSSKSTLNPVPHSPAGTDGGTVIAPQEHGADGGTVIIRPLPPPRSTEVQRDLCGNHFGSRGPPEPRAGLLVGPQGRVSAREGRRRTPQVGAGKAGDVSEQLEACSGP